MFDDEGFVSSAVEEQLRFRDHELEKAAAGLYEKSEKPESPPSTPDDEAALNTGYDTSVLREMFEMVDFDDKEQHKVTVSQNKVKCQLGTIKGQIWYLKN